MNKFALFKWMWIFQNQIWMEYEKALFEYPLFDSDSYFLDVWSRKVW